MKITILGLNHHLQWKDTPDRRLHSILREFLSTSTIELIAEEAYSLPTTVGQRLANSLDIPWIDVDMGEAQRRLLAIDASSTERYKSIENEKGECIGGIHFYFPDFDRAREEYWIKRLSGLQMARVATLKSVLFICGILHVEPFREKLEQHGCAIEILDIKNSDWFKEIYGIHTIIAADENGYRRCEVKYPRK